MVDRYHARPWLEALEDRMLPSSSPIVLFLDSAGSGNQPSTSWSAKVTQLDGKVLTVGAGFGSSGNSVNVLERFNADGAVDVGFGSRGEVSTSIEADPGEVCGLSIQPDGKILLAVDPPGATSITAARFNPDGSPDDTFAPGGIVSLPLAPVPGDSANLVAKGTGVIVYLDANSVQLPFNHFSAALGISTPSSLTDYLSPGGYLTTQLPWSQGNSSSQVACGTTAFSPSSGQVVLGGYLTTQSPWSQVNDPRSTGSGSSPGFHSLVAFSSFGISSPGSDTRATWIGSSPVTQGPAVFAVTLDLRPSGVDLSPLAQDSAAYLILLTSFVGSDNPQSAVDFSLAVPPPLALKAPNTASSSLPSYLDVDQIVPAGALVLLPPPSVSTITPPAKPAAAVGLPAYLVPPNHGRQSPPRASHRPRKRLATTAWPPSMPPSRSRSTRRNRPIPRMTSRGPLCPRPLGKKKLRARAPSPGSCGLPSSSPLRVAARPGREPAEWSASRGTDRGRTTGPRGDRGDVVQAPGRPGGRRTPTRRAARFTGLGEV